MPPLMTAFIIRALLKSVHPIITIKKNLILIGYQHALSFIKLHFGVSAAKVHSSKVSNNKIAYNAYFFHSSLYSHPSTDLTEITMKMKDDRRREG